MNGQALQKEPAHHVVPPEPTFVEARPATYLAMEGSGPPTLPGPRVDALLRVATTVQTEAFSNGRGFALGFLESLWWAPTDGWERWMHLVRVPAFVTDEQVQRARERIPGDTRLLDGVHVERMDEGTCLQALHVGTRDEVHSTYEVLRRLARTSSLELAGPAHEVHLDDPAEVARADMRTVCRLPVRPASA